MEALMKNWWLDLYTIPFLKLLGRAFAVVAAATIIVRMFAPQILAIMPFLTLYFCTLIVAETKVGLVANIEFHKLHVAYPELRKAFFKDFLIRMGSTILALFIALYLCAPDVETVGTTATIVIAFMINIGVLIGVLSVRKTNNGKVRYSVYNREHLSGILRFGQAVCATFFITLFIGLNVIYGFNLYIIFGILISSMAFFFNLYAQRAMFHLEKEKGSFKSMLKYSSKGMATAAVVFFVGVVLLRPLVNDHGADPVVQQIAFDYVGPFSPELDIETAKVLLTEYDVDMAKVFKETPGINQVPVSALFKKPTMGQYLSYLEHVKNPTTENLLYLLKNSEKYKGDPRLKSRLNTVVMRKWPKSEKFPEDYLDKKLVKEERMPASTQVEPQN
jgi:hypothetical protein